MSEKKSKPEKNIGNSLQDLGKFLQDKDSKQNEEFSKDIYKKNQCESQSNFGYFFYKDFYLNDNGESIFIDNSKKIDKHLSEKSEKFLELKFNPKTASFTKDLQNLSKYTIKYFTLQTTYPGLLIGSGYIHETGNEGEFKLGFFFDFSTGLPIIPGSSVKGVLRSAFSHSDYIASQLKQVIKDKEININVKFIKQLELNIFENEELINKGDYKETKDNKYKNPYKRDIFFDAIPCSIKNTKTENGNENILFAEDFITPHKNPLKNPIPLKFLKIKSYVEFKFFFKLSDTVIRIGLEDYIFSSEDKIKLFENIILDIGIGAKTNVGYGVFEQNKILKK